jgi:hypothetical protein
LRQTNSFNGFEWTIVHDPTKNVSTDGKHVILGPDSRGTRIHGTRITFIAFVRNRLQSQKKKEKWRDKHEYGDYKW